MRKLLTVIILMVLSTVSYGVMWGDDAVYRSQVDQAWSITFINTGMPSQISGKISQWYLYVSPVMVDNYVKLQVFRPVSGGYQLIGQNVFTLSSTGSVTLAVAETQQIDIQAGDMLGFHYNGPTYLAKRSIVFDYVENGNYIYSLNWPTTAHDVSINGIIPSSDMGDGGRGRNYSLAAEVIPEPATIALLCIGGIMLRKSRVF
ncbi:MAG: PEP-CTERM sorting domain-containing protein [Planctomycetaceae bacterium]|nr:PEP-CTERM sorting domain-containing protein [Planctomycetaceae bacterium]